MKVPEVLPRVVEALNAAGIGYMLTGSFAGAYYGFLRSTQDIDLIVEGDRSQLLNFVKNLPSSEFYVDPESAFEAQKRKSMFNIIDLKTGWKIDLVIRKSRTFSLEEFRRRRKLTLGASDFFVVSPEDLILAKLEWAKLGESRRQIEDAAGILRAIGSSLDKAYIDRWALDLQLISEWKSAKQMAGFPHSYNSLLGESGSSK